MRLLLDTHVLVWLAEGLSELPVRSRKRINAAAAAGGLAVSAISFWEVAMLAERNRISLSEPVTAWRQRVLAAQGIVEAPMSGDIGIEAVHLPGKLHGDPADRILAATARSNGWTLATRDRRLLDYGAAGHVSVAAM